jgi:hypothetical protein
MGIGPEVSHFKPADSAVAACGLSGSSKYRVVPTDVILGAGRHAKVERHTWNVFHGFGLQYPHTHLDSGVQGSPHTVYGVGEGLRD